MAEGESSPLLNNWGWEDIESLEDHVSEHCTVCSLFQEHPHDIVRYLQRSGLAKLGEFKEKDSLVFRAFETDPVLTLGSDRRRIDYEQEWRKALRQYSKGEKSSGWSADITLEAFVVTIQGAAAPDKDGLLQPILKRWQAGACTHSVFALPVVQAVITWKWHAYARRMLLLELACFVLWLFSFNAFTIAFQDEDLSLGLGALLRTPRGKVELAAHMGALLGMSPFLLLELGTLPAYGFHGWFDAWNGLDIATYLIQITVTTVHLARWQLKSDWLTGLLALGTILLVFRLQYYTKALRPTRFAFLDTIVEVIQDVKTYLLFLLLVMWGFGCAFHIVFRRDQEENEEYSSILRAFLAMFEHQYGDVELEPMYQSKSPFVATTLGVAYTLIMGLVLINLLIGIVLNSVEKATEGQDTKLLLSKARIIDELEATMPRWLERRNPSWFPRFVHVLRINPNKLDEVEVDALWSRMGEDAPPIVQGGAGNGQQGGDGEAPPPVASSGPGWEGVDQAEGRQEAASQQPSGPSGGQGDSDVLQRLDRLQQQLDQQGRMLARLCRRLELSAHDAEE